MDRKGSERRALMGPQALSAGPARSYYAARYQGESWTDSDVAGDVRETCSRLGWTAAEMEANPAVAQKRAVEIWKECERISEMSGDIPVNDY